MTEEENKQSIRNLIDYSIKIQVNNDIFYLYYNKSYLRALKLSKITGKPVNQKNFKGGNVLFWFNAKTKKYNYYLKIQNHLHYNYSEDYVKRLKLIEEVLNEYEEYKGYKF